MRKIAILVLAAFLLTLLPTAVLAKPDQARGNKWAQKPGVTVKTENRGDFQVVTFDDIDDSWASGFIKKAAKKGLVEGFMGKYQPNKPVTNLELITMLVRALDKDGQLDLDEADVSKYDLKKIPAWGQEYVAAAVEFGIILPDELSSFNPNQGCKRGQVALYVARILGDNAADNDETVDFDSISEDVDDIIAALEGLDDLDEDNDEIQDNIDSLIEDLEDFQDQLDDAEKADLADLIADFKKIQESLDDIIADAEDAEVDEDILDELSDAAQQASAVKKALKAYNDIDEDDSFSDEDQVPGEYKGSVKKVKRFRIMVGDDDGCFSPMRVVKRDEIATLLSRLTDLIFGEFDITSAKGTLDAVDNDSITIIDADEEELTFNITEDTRITYKKQSVDIEDLADYEGYVVVVVYDVDDDASTVKIVSSSTADDDEEDDEEDDDDDDEEEQD